MDRFSDPRHIKWAKESKQRDNFTCLICGKQGVYLESHHANSFDWCIDERFNLENAKTLCKFCHNKFHDIYGHGQNTIFQYNEFVEIYKLLREIALKNQ